MCHAQSSSILEAHAGGHCCHVSASVLSKVLKPEDSRPQREHDGAALHQLNSLLQPGQHLPKQMPTTLNFYNRLNTMQLCLILMFLFYNASQVILFVG